MTSLLKRNEQFAVSYAPPPLGPPTMQTLVLTCLDHRVDPAAFMGIKVGEAFVIRNAGGRITQAVIDDIAYLSFLAARLSGGQGSSGPLFEVAIIHHTQCGSGFLADPDFRREAAEATGVADAVLKASAVTDPKITVHNDVEHLLNSPSLSPRVSVSGYVYDIATGGLTAVVDTQYRQPVGPS